MEFNEIGWQRTSISLSDPVQVSQYAAEVHKFKYQTQIVWLI